MKREKPANVTEANGPNDLTPRWQREWPEFEHVLKTRLQQGHLNYDDKSFTFTLKHLTDEIEQELLDIVGWSFIMWCRVKELKDTMP